jgi:hypothetical protein
MLPIFLVGEVLELNTPDHKGEDESADEADDELEFGAEAANDAVGKVFGFAHCGDIVGLSREFE